MQSTRSPKSKQTISFRSPHWISLNCNNNLARHHRHHTMYNFKCNINKGVNLPVGSHWSLSYCGVFLPLLLWSWPLCTDRVAVTILIRGPFRIKCSFLEGRNGLIIACLKPWNWLVWCILKRRSIKTTAFFFQLETLIALLRDRFYFVGKR